MTKTEFSEAYQQGLKRTTAFLLSCGVPSDVVPDFAQTAWLRAWERLGQLRDDSMIVPWINTIALNYYRRARRTRSREEEWKPVHSNMRSTVLNWAAIDVSRILKACRPTDRKLLKDQLLGTTSKEIAAREGVTPTAIRIRLLRARRSARQLCDTGLDSMPEAA